MAQPILTQQVVSFNGQHFIFSKVNYEASGNTVEIPLGSAASVAVLAESGTAPSATRSQGTTVDTVTLTGATGAKDVWVISLHLGNPASLR